MHAHDYRQLSVLFVDDEENSRSLFRAALEPEFSILTASSATEAIHILRAPDSRVGVVVSDQRMPGEGGALFLGQVRYEAPMTVRILTTAYADVEAAIDGVNLGSIYKYLVKPWDLEKLRATVRQAMEYCLLRQERDLLLKEKLATLQHLLVADRVRGLAALARGLSHHIRNALTPLESHVFLAKTERDPESKRDSDSHRLRELSTDAETVNRHLLDIVESVSAATVELRYEFSDRATLESLLLRGHAQAARSGESIVMAELPPIPTLLLHCDAAAMTHVFAALLRQMARLHRASLRAGDRPGVSVEYLGTTRLWGSPAEWLRLRAQGVWDREAVASAFTPFAMAPHGAAKMDSDLLTAFFIVHQHGGTLELRAQAPDGPGLELALPHDPLGVERPPLETNSFERLLLHAEDWQRLERSP